MKKVFLAVILGGAIVLVAGCSRNDKLVQEKAEEIEAIFNANEMEEINQLVFGEDINTEYDYYYSNEEIEGNETGVIEVILCEVTLETGEITDNSIEYKVSAPDLSNVFLELDIELAQTMTEEDLLNYIKEYIEQTEQKSSAVSIPYEIVNDEVIVDLQNAEFINVITGGIAEAYTDLYGQMLEEYRQEFGE